MKEDSEDVLDKNVYEPAAHRDIRIQDGLSDCAREVLLIGMWPNEWSSILHGQHRVVFFVSGLLRIALDEKEQHAS